MKYQIRTTKPTGRHGAVKFAFTAIALLTLGTEAFAGGNNGNPGVLPPQSSPYGASYGEGRSMVGLDSLVSSQRGPGQWECSD